MTKKRSAGNLILEMKDQEEEENEHCDRSGAAGAEEEDKAYGSHETGVKQDSVEIGNLPGLEASSNTIKTASEWYLPENKCVKIGLW